MHQHLQPGRDAGCRPGREEGRRAWPEGAAVGEDLDRTGLAGGFRLPRKDRPAEGTGEGRLLHRRLRLHHLASPALVVAYALAGTQDSDRTKDAIGTGSDGQPVYLKDIWPSNKEISDTIAGAINPAMFEKNYADV